MPAPHDIYQHDVDFTALALQYPEFAKRLKPNRQLDFTDPESARQLTKSLLHRDFDLTIELPEDRLCPPVPNRFNYIEHLQRLLDTTAPSFRDVFDTNRQVIGLDIGTGASCIYPLLACRQREKWLVLATEIDEKSRSVAQRNIEANGLDTRIKIIDTDLSSRTLIPVKELERFERIDFLMTNPPFYASSKQMLASAKAKSRPPNSSCTGSPTEMIYPHQPESSSTSPNQNADGEGGEVAFVTQLLNESTSPDLRTKIQWFTAMLGHLSSLSTLVTRLKERGCTNYAVWEFVQGQKTRRWGVAWSWMGMRPSVAVARGVPGLEKRLLPLPSEADIEVDVDPGPGPGGRALQDLGNKIDDVVSELEDEEDEEGMQWQWKEKQLVGLAMSRRGDCWSRKARRKKEGKSKERDLDMKDVDNQDDDGEEEKEREPAFVVKISVKAREDTPEKVRLKDEDAASRSAVVHIRWLQGHDAVLFESFRGWLKRKLTN